MIYLTSAFHKVLIWVVHIRSDSTINSNIMSLLYVIHWLIYMLFLFLQNICIQTISKSEKNKKSKIEKKSSNLWSFRKDFHTFRSRLRPKDVADIPIRAHNHKPVSNIHKLNWIKMSKASFLLIVREILHYKIIFNFFNILFNKSLILCNIIAKNSI